MSLDKRCMLVTLSIRQWLARKQDKRGTNELMVVHNTTKEWTRAQKTLVAAEEIKKLTAISNEARTFHYANTLPWNKGQNILTAENYLPYMEKMRKHEAQWIAGVERFISMYPDLVEDAKSHLNGLYNADDYPSPQFIADKFGFKVEIYPLPCSGDFRVDLINEERDKIRAEIATAQTETINKAMVDIWTRFRDAIQHIKIKLSTKDAIFRDTLIDNVTELTELLPRLNIMNDEKLNELCTEAKVEFSGLSPDVLRHDLTARGNTALKAKELLDKMSSYTGGVL